MAERIPQSTTIRVPLQAYLASDHATPAPGVTVAITISKNGAAYGNPAAGATNAAAISNGSYYVDLLAADTDTLGPLFIKGTSATIDDVVTIYNVTSQNVVKTGDAIGRGTVTSGGTTTSVPTSVLKLANAAASGVVADQFKNRVVLFDGDTTTAGLRGATAVITASSASNTPTLTVGTLPATPASGDTFSIV